MIELKNVSKIYKDKNKRKVLALNDVSLKLPDSGMVFIFGKSGSGKSTMLNLISGLDKVTSGDIIVDNKKFSEFKEGDFDGYRGSYLGIIFQDYHLLEELTVRENLALAGDLANETPDLLSLLKEVELNESYLDKYPRQLSGGERQRVAIARTLGKKSKVILADEPTGNLDLANRIQIFDILHKISKDVLVLVVSHNTIDAANYADRIITLDNGMVIYDKIRKPEYDNNFKVVDSKAYLPHNKNLKQEEINSLYNVSSVVQMDDGLIDNIEDIKVTKEASFVSGKLERKKFLKLFKSFFKKRKLSKVLVIFISAVLISLFYVFQSYCSFDSNDIQKNELINNNEVSLALRKVEYVGNGNVASDSLKEISYEDYNAFKNTDYKGNVFKLYNTCINFEVSDISNQKYITPEENTASFYALESYGVLECNEKFLISVYGKNNKLDILAESKEKKEYGIVLTDYLADGILHYNKSIKSYDDLVGLFNSEYNKIYVNMIINTGYKEKYSSLISIYERLFDLDKSNDPNLDEIYNDSMYMSFLYEVNKYLAVAYSFSDNYYETLLENNFLDTIHSATISNIYNGKTYKSFNYYKIKRDYSLKDNEMVVSSEYYKTMFDCSDSDVENFIPHSVKFIIRNDNGNYEKEFFIKEIVSYKGRYVFVSSDVFDDIIPKTIINYGMYFDNVKDIDKVLNIKGNEYLYLSLTVEGVGLIEKSIKIFGDFLMIFAVLFLCICVLYLVSFGYKNIKQNIYEISILVSLGGRKKDVSKIFILDTLVVGVGIIILSTIGMYIAAVSSNSILVNAFESRFSVNLYDLKIIDYKFNQVVLDLFITVVIVYVSAIIPTFFIRRMSLTDALKAKE